MNLLLSDPAFLSVASAIGGGGATDPYFNNVSLLLHCDGANGSTTIIDSSSSPKTVTAIDNASISTAQSKFGGASAFIDGAGDYLLVPMSAALQPGTGDFTIEGWFYIDTLKQYMSMFSLGAFSTGILLRRSQLANDLFINGSSYSYSPTAFTTGSWHHIALTRGSGSVNLWINGTSVLTVTNTSNIVPANDFHIGASQHTSGESWHGYIDEFRFTKGIARYTSNFTPPTAPFPDA